MGNCRTAWASHASVICPLNERGNTRPSDLPPINPTFGHAAVLCSRETEFCGQRPKLIVVRHVVPPPHIFVEIEDDYGDVIGYDGRT